MDNQDKILELCKQKRKLRAALTVVSYMLVKYNQNPIAVIKMCEHLQEMYMRKEHIIYELVALMPPLIRVE